MATLNELSEQVRDFREQRDWRKFHTAKSMAISLMLEAAEVGELFQWTPDGQIAQLESTETTRLGEELSDVLYWVLAIANDAGIDLGSAFNSKMQKNQAKYPVEKSRGVSTKYTDLP